jgi:hypothetical protein
MAVAVASVSTNSTFATGTSMAANKPTGLAVGDLMVAHVAQYTTTTGTFFPPSGSWVQVQAFSTGNVAGYVFTKVADAGDVAASTFTFTFTQSAPHALSIYRVTGGTIVEVSTGATGNTTTLATFTFSGFTQGYANSLQMMFLVHQSSTTSIPTASGYAYTTDNPTWAEDYDVGFNAGNPSYNFAAANGVRANTTAAGTMTVLLAFTTAGSSAVVIALSILPTLTVSLLPTSITTLFNMAPKFLTGFATFLFGSNLITLSKMPTQWTDQSKNTTPWVDKSKS